MIMRHNNIFKDAVHEIIKDLKIFDKYESLLFQQKIARAIFIILFILLAGTTIYSRIESNKQLKFRDAEIEKLSKQYSSLLSFMPSDELELKFISFGDSLISGNKLSDLDTEDRNIFLHSVWSNCREFNMNPYIILHTADIESDFRQFAKSPKGARGILQILPSTYKMCAFNLHEEYDKNEIFMLENQARYATFYLRSLYDDCEDIKLALSRYNEGHTTIINNYANKIMLNVGENYDSNRGINWRGQISGGQSH